jgi:hypothetical protein
MYCEPMRLVWLAPMFACAAVGTIAACENDDVVYAFGDDDAGAESGAALDATPTDALGPPPDGSAPQVDADVLTDAEAGADGSSPQADGGVPCGAGTCAALTQTCCIAADGTETCTAAGPNACGAATEKRCTGATQCGAGTVCCATFTATFIGSTCVTKCSGARKTLCESSAECAGGSCVTNVCSGKTVRTCGAVPAGQCH